MFTKLLKYGIAPRHITKLIPVSRATASAWLNGHTAPIRYLEPEVARLNAALDEAVKDKKIPRDIALARARDKHIVDTLRSYMKKTGKASARLT